MVKSKERVKTKLGLVNENNQGYYRLTNNELLHRKVWEEYYGQKIPEGYVIHHIDHNPLNNSISNLQLMTFEDHARLHHKGKVTKEEVKEELSRQKTSTGYFRVNRKPCPRCKRGFIYRYQYIDEFGCKKAITSTSFKKLMLKVQGKGLPWKKI